MREAERDLRQALGRVSVPEEGEAAERAWRLVRAAAAERPRVRPAPRLRRRGLQLALVLGLLVALVSPAGASVRHWVSDVVSPGVERAQPALTSLPTRGSLLVRSAQGIWVVHADGSKRLLGAYDEATWSPHGLYVAVTSRHQLATVDPTGKVRWTLDRRGPVRLPSWNGPDGFRLAYLSGSSLRVVHGDGSDDRLLAPRVAPVAPAWMPGPRYVLAFARPNGRVEAIRSESGAPLFETGREPRPLSLQWAGDGQWLQVTRPKAIEFLDDAGAVRWRWQAPAGTRIRASRLAPSGDRVAVILAGPAGGRLVIAGPHFPARTIFSGPGRFSGVQWSPGGGWLLLAWKSADQWLFLNGRRPGRIEAISRVSAQLDPGATAPARFPTIAGWCCEGQGPRDRSEP